MKRSVAVILFLVGAVFGSNTVYASPNDEMPYPKYDYSKLWDLVAAGNAHVRFEDDTFNTLKPSWIEAHPHAPGGSYRRCSSVFDAICNSVSLVQYYAVLPPCTTPAQLDCIQGLAIRTGGSDWINAGFDQLMPETPTYGWSGNSAIGLPSGSSPSIWSIADSGATSRTQFAVIVRLTGSSIGKTAGSPVQMFTSTPELSVNVFPVTTKTSPSYGPIVIRENDRGLSFSMSLTNGNSEAKDYLECAALASGECAQKLNFIPGTEVSVSLRLTNQVPRWFHGRIAEPEFSSAQIAGGGYQVTLLGGSVENPSVIGGTQIRNILPQHRSRFYSWCPQLETDLDYLCQGYIGGGDSGGASSVSNLPFYENVTEALGDSAAWTRNTWYATSLAEGSGSGVVQNCTNPARAIDGFVATNSRWYVSGPPSFNATTGTLDYTVLSPHFRPEGTPFKGTYDLLIDRDVADCIYNLNPANPVTGQISLEYPNSERAPTAASISEVDGWVRLSVSGFTFSSPTVKADLNATPSTSINQAFVPLTPVRIMDTRSGLGAPTGQVGDGLDGGAPLVFKVTGRGNVPLTGVGAVSLNVTASETEAPSYGGYVTIYPCGTRPEASNLNFRANQAVPNAVITPVPADGNICFYVYGKANLIVDVNGYFKSGVGFNAVSPSRVADTRTGLGVSQDQVGDFTMNAQPIEVKVTGLANVPATGVSSVSVNLTATNTSTGSSAGFVTAYPCGARPNASNLNFTANATVPNAVIVPVSSRGTICLFVYGKADLFVDVNGWFARTNSFTSLGPTRVLDTRTGEGTEFIGRPGGDYVLKLPLTGLHDLPQTGVGAVSLNVTVTGSDSPENGGGYVTVYPCGTAPEASNLNFTTGQTIANAVIVPLSDTGRVCFRVYGQTHLIADINGWFPG